TADDAPALHRPALGAAAVATPLAAPQAPLTTVGVGVGVAMPTPLKGMVRSLPRLKVATRVPLTAPALVGVKVTWTTNEPRARSTTGCVKPLTAKGGCVLTLSSVRLLRLALVMVTGDGALVVPTNTPVNTSDDSAMAPSTGVTPSEPPTSPETVPEQLH